MSAAIRRPRAVAFDVNETLIDLSGLRDTFEGLGLPERALEWWFAALLRDGLALAATGLAAPFPDLSTVALEEVFAATGRPCPSQAAQALLRSFGQLAAHPDVVAALELLARAGVPALALTNGAAATATGLLERAGLSSLLPQVLSAEAVGHWKPRPEPYLYAARATGIDPTELAMVAVHPWDLHGAGAVGLVTGWVNRTGRTYPPAFHPATVEGASPERVVDALLGLPIP